MIHAEAWQWLQGIFTGRLRASIHQSYELEDARGQSPKEPLGVLVRRLRISYSLTTICLPSPNVDRV